MKKTIKSTGQATHGRPDSQNLTDLYRDVILRHSSSPFGFEEEIAPTHFNEQYNPQCGDRVCVKLRIVDTEIEAAAFDGAACAICTASASLLCMAASGLKIDELELKKERLEQAIKSADLVQLDDSLNALLAVKHFPSRIKCALLPWEAAVAAVET